MAGKRKGPLSDGATGGPRKRPVRMSKDRAESIVAHVRDGLTLKDACAQENVTAKSFRNYREKHPEWEDAYQEALAEADERAEARAEEELTEKARGICTLLAEGNTLGAACKAYGTTRATFFGWRERYPAIDSLYEASQRVAVSFFSDNMHLLASQLDYRAIEFMLVNKTRHLPLSHPDRYLNPKSIDLRVIEAPKEEPVDEAAVAEHEAAVGDAHDDLARYLAAMEEAGLTTDDMGGDMAAG